MSEPEAIAIDPELIRGLAALVGIGLSTQRAGALVSQAEPHFAQLRALDGVADPGAEPAAVFRLDNWPKDDDG